MTQSATGGAAPSGPARLAPVASVSRRDGAVNEIRRAVVLGHIKPGEKLTETQLSEWLGVSRPTVREAVNQVVQEGLIIQEPYRGLRVASLDTATLIDVAKTRMALDMVAVDGILADDSGRRLRMVEDCWAKFEPLEYDADAYVRHESHLEFHRGIWLASENKLLPRLWPVTRAHMTIALAQDQAARSDPDRSHHVHDVLMHVLRGGDREVIRQAFEAHTMNSANELIEILQRNEGN